MNKSLIIISGFIVLVVLGGAGFLMINKSETASTIQTQPVASANSKSYTLAEVQSHNTQSSCWSVVNNKVYDLTNWISKHPGGPGRILSLCGTDGSAAFNGQHEGERRPANELQGFYIGNLSSN